MNSSYAIDFSFSLGNSNSPLADVQTGVIFDSSFPLPSRVAQVPAGYNSTLKEYMRKIQNIL